MTPFGMRMEILEGAKVGSAAAVKMCRSIVVKGIEALLFECVMAATNSTPTTSVSRRSKRPGRGSTGRNSPTTRADASSPRRAAGEGDGRSSPRPCGPSASTPINGRSHRAAAGLGRGWDLRAHFGPEGPKTYAEVVEVIAKLS